MDDILFLSRLQFAITSIYHFFFVPLTIGLGFFIALWETLAYKSGNSEDDRIVKFWGRLFLLNFVVGVVTGIVQEFQFGMNWSEYSRFVGDVFGAPLAIEALLAFFMESVFLGLWMFGRNILPRGVHLTCIWLVFAASCLSAIWILIANSFMQHPVGYALNNGRAEMTDFLDLITNPYFLHQLPHVISASITTAAFFILGISAWRMLQNSEDSFLFEKTFKHALFMGLIGISAVILSGHLQGQSIAKLQPMKLAAMENLKKTSDPAPLSIAPGVEIPAMLSFMVYNRPSGEIQGLENLQNAFEYRYGKGDYTPPVWVCYISFRIMVGASFVMLFFVIYGISWHLFMKKNMHRKIMFSMLLGISLPYIANSAGWLLAEMGRQPWIVYGLMPTDKAISVGVSRGSIIFSIISFTIIYGILAAITFALMRREVFRGCKSKKPTRKTAAITV